MGICSCSRKPSLSTAFLLCIHKCWSFFLFFLLCHSRPEHFGISSYLTQLRFLMLWYMTQIISRLLDTSPVIYFYFLSLSLSLWPQLTADLCLVSEHQKPSPSAPSRDTKWEEKASLPNEPLRKAARDNLTKPVSKSLILEGIEVSSTACECGWNMK